jgi:hypothetical protein
MVQLFPPALRRTGEYSLFSLGSANSQCRGESGFVAWFGPGRPISMRPLNIAPSSMLMRAV